MYETLTGNGIKMVIFKRIRMLGLKMFQPKDKS